MCAASTTVAKGCFLVAPSPPRSGKSRRLRLGLKSRAVSALVRNFAPSPLGTQKSRRFRYGHDIKIIGRAASASVWKVALSPPRSRKSWKCTFWSRWPSRSRRCFLSRAASTTVAKNCFLVAPSPPRSGKSRRLRLGLKSRVVSTLVWKSAPSPLWTRKSRRFHYGRDKMIIGRAASASVWKVALSPPWSRKSWKCTFWSRRFLSRAVSTMVAKVAPSPPRSRKPWKTFS